MALSGKKILVTGASGFIGSFLVERALQLGAEVWAAVRRTSSRAYLTDPRIRFVELDFDRSETLTEQLCAAGPWDFVLHAAGATKGRDEADFFRVNTDGTRRFAETLVATGMLRGRFVFLSSLSVLGPVRQERRGTAAPFYAEMTDDDTPRPNSAYGRSKLAAEEALAAIDGLDYVVLRPTGVYGPREKDYFLMAKSIAGHIDFAVGYAPQEITFIYVRDLVEASLLALTAGPSRRAYFLTDGGVYDSRTFSRLLQRALGVRRVWHIVAPLWVLRAVCAVSGWWASRRGKTTTLNADKYHILRQRNWRCDIRPARELLGYAPQWPLARGVQETVAWYRQAEWL